MASRRGGSSKQGDRVTLTVWHGERDSFSRSVDRCAIRWAREHEWMRGASSVSLVSADYAVRKLVTGECESDLVFRVIR